MKQIFSIFILIANINFIFPQEKVILDTNKTRIKFDPARDPYYDLKQAVLEAKKTNRNILLDVGGEWCIWCHRLDEFFEMNKDVSDLLKENFIVVKVNYSPENKNVNFLSKYPKVPGYPHFFVLNKKGKLIHSQNTGELELEKGYDHNKVVTFFKEWAPK